jgi:hypothetical protein
LELEVIASEYWKNKTAGATPGRVRTIIYTLAAFFFTAWLA